MRLVSMRVGTKPLCSCSVDWRTRPMRSSSCQYRSFCHQRQSELCFFCFPPPLVLSAGIYCSWCDPELCGSSSQQHQTTVPLAVSRCDLQLTDARKGVLTAAVFIGMIPGGLVRTPPCRSATSDSHELPAITSQPRAASSTRHASPTVPCQGGCGSHTYHLGSLKRR